MELDFLMTKQAVVALTVKTLELDEPFEKIFEIRENSASNSLNEFTANQLFPNIWGKLKA